jgi:Zn finger protein HypA/HybF involved in hydrogenase expression
MNEKKVKQEIEEKNLWYFVQCQHCFTNFLVEESIDNNPKLGDPEDLTFQCYCPRCKTVNSQIATTGRLRLSVVHVAKRNEFDPLTTKMAKKLKVEGLDYNKKKVDD